jgi:hypothetical protein
MYRLLMMTMATAMTMIYSSGMNSKIAELTFKCWYTIAKHRILENSSGMLSNTEMYSRKLCDFKCTF